MNELKNLYLQNPEVKKIVLSKRKLNDSHNVFKELEKFLELTELDVSYNEITQLPENLSSLANLQVLDLTNNPLENFEYIGLSLASLPKLIDLKINLSTQNEALAILNNLPNLEFLNGKSTKDDEIHIVDIEEKEIENIAIDKDELEKYSKIFQKISEKLKTIGVQTEQFKENYENLLKTEIEKINGCIEGSVPNYMYASQILGSKLNFGNFFIQNFLNFLTKKDQDSAAIIKEIFVNNLQSSEQLQSIIDKLYPKIQDKTSMLKQQLDNAVKDANNVDNAIHSLEEKVKQTIREKDFLVKQHQDERQLLLEKIQRLEEENRLMTDKILKRTKDMVNDSMVQNTLQKNNNDNSMYGGNNTQNYGDVNMKSKTGNSTIIGPTGARVLTKKMMKDVIEEIYESKTNFDKKCLEAKLPRETMEQHMYTFLNQKYGLKNLIIEWASSIINGIKMYSAEDNDICVFGKILRNECEEEFRIVLQKVKNTITDLLTFYLKGKFPLKSNGDIKEIVSQKNNGLLLEEEWKEIIFYMYEQEDANYLYGKIVEHIKRKYIDKKTIENNKKLTREEMINLSRTKEEYKIPFGDFQKIILDFQLKSHDKYLRNFVYLFKRVDQDNNGIINEEEFLNMLQAINIYKEDFNEQAQRLLNIIDPYNKQYITFSETVSLFSMEFILEDDGQGNKRKLSILERISLDDSILTA